MEEFWVQQLYMCRTTVFGGVLLPAHLFDAAQSKVDRAAVLVPRGGRVLGPKARSSKTKDLEAKRLPQVGETVPIRVVDDLQGVVMYVNDDGTIVVDPSYVYAKWSNEPNPGWLAIHNQKGRHWSRPTFLRHDSAPRFYFGVLTVTT